MRDSAQGISQLWGLGFGWEFVAGTTVWRTVQGDLEEVLLFADVASNCVYAFEANPEEGTPLSIWGRKPGARDVTAIKGRPGAEDPDDWIVAFGAGEAATLTMLRWPWGTPLTDPQANLGLMCEFPLNQGPMTSVAPGSRTLRRLSWPPDSDPNYILNMFRPVPNTANQAVCSWWELGMIRDVCPASTEFGPVPPCDRFRETLWRLPRDPACTSSDTLDNDPAGALHSLPDGARLLIVDAVQHDEKLYLYAADQTAGTGHGDAWLITLRIEDDLAQINSEQGRTSWVPGGSATAGDLTLTPLHLLKVPLPNGNRWTTHDGSKLVKSPGGQWLARMLRESA